MNIAVVQQVQTNMTVAAGAHTLTPITVTAGNLLILQYITAGGTTDFIHPITDDQSNTWVKAPNTEQAPTFGDDGKLAIWYAANIAGGVTTITINTFGVTTNRTDVSVLECSGASTTVPLVPGSGAIIPNTTLPPVGPDLTPDKAGELLVTIILPDSSSATSVNAPWIYTLDPAAGGVFTQLVNPTPGTTHAVMQPTNPQAFASSGAIFQPVGISNKRRSSMFLVF